MPYFSLMWKKNVKNMRKSFKQIIVGMSVHEGLDRDAILNKTHTSHEESVWRKTSNSSLLKTHHLKSTSLGVRPRRKRLWPADDRLSDCWVVNRPFGRRRARPVASQARVQTARLVPVWFLSLADSRLPTCTSHFTPFHFQPFWLPSSPSSTWFLLINVFCIGWFLSRWRQ